MHSNASQRTALSVTVYNSNFALVRERRQLQLGQGLVALTFEDVAAHVEPTSVMVRAVGAPAQLSVLEQNYRYDVLAPEVLLEKYIGRSVKVARYNQQLGKDEIVSAEILGAGPVLRIDDQIVTGMPGRFIFPELPPNLVQKPTLVWLLASRSDQQELEVSYLTQNLSWQASYVLSLSADAARGKLSGWVTLVNQTGVSFPDAKLDLVAGDVQHQPTSGGKEIGEGAASGLGEADRQLSEQALFEYHLYSLDRPTDVLDREQKQVSLLEADGVRVDTQLVLHGSPDFFRATLPALGGVEKVSVVLLIENESASNLGMPLPKGTVRVYKTDTEGAAQFVGEDRIDHTPQGESIELDIGKSFDVVGARKQLAFRALGNCSAESDWQVELRNHKAEAVNVEVLEPTSSEWTLVRSSQPHEPRDAHSFAFQVNVPANAAAQVTYTVRVRWC